LSIAPHQYENTSYGLWPISFMSRPRECGTHEHRRWVVRGPAIFLEHFPETGFPSENATTLKLEHFPFLFDPKVLYRRL
jgi:hypothetical protein